MLTRFAALVLLTVPCFAQHQPVLMISVDGMRPDYVTHADEHHLKIPTLRRMMQQGVYADGVIGVFPTVTYPSHTTLVTGVSPAEHGIFNNQQFDPERHLSGAWYWYATQIKVPSLFDAVHAAGLHTASISWPVTADSAAIDYLIPEYWRTASPADAFNPADRLLMNALSRPDGEAARIAVRTGTPYMKGNETTAEGDEVRTVYALDMLRQHRPEFVTVHLSSLDEVEHEHGPFSPEADAELELIDAMIARLAAQELANFPGAAIAVVSDHGFAHVEHATNLFIPFLKVGLIQTSMASGTLQVTSWQAEPWFASGLAAIILHDPANTTVREQVRTLLNTLAADPDSGIEAVLDAEQIHALGGFPDAAFAVTLKPGYYTGAALSGPLVTPLPGRGTHGYNPATSPDMQASFFLTGAGIARGKDLGRIDMRQVAPTLAGVLGVALPTAKQGILQVAIAGR